MGPLLEIDQSNLPRIDGCTFGVCMLWTKIAEQSVSVNCRATRFDHCFHFRSIQALKRRLLCFASYFNFSFLCFGDMETVAFACLRMSVWESQKQVP